jgi:outer membrane protein OmpA-like peptidoglycan-associated protein/tetratricopeptide (TPR) repeat protein
MKNILALFILVFFSACSTAQMNQWDTKSKKAIKLVEQGMAKARELDQSTSLPNYAGGIPYFDKAIEKDPNFTDAYRVKADYAIRIGNKSMAIDAYRSAIAINPELSSTGYIYFELAQLEWSNGEYDEALLHAKKYQSMPGANPDFREDVNWLIKNCEFAIDAVKHPKPYDPINVGVGVNSEEPEYLPTLTVDQKQLLFTRRVTGSNGYQQEDFFTSTDMNGYWGNGEPMPPNINTYFNEGGPTFAPDGRTLIFVGCSDPRYGYGEGRRGYGSCDLFITEKIGQKWLDPINLPGRVNTKNWETQPSLSADGKTLYFIRGILTGSGRTDQRVGDIYVSKMAENGMWGEPVKLPENVNTPASESSVFIHADGRTLYFSSNGHIGMGGYDLYKTTLQPDGSWSDPENLGYPINTAENETAIIVYPDGDLAIIGSDMPGGLGESDLYTFKMPKDIQPTRTIYMSGTVFDNETKEKLEAEFSLVDLATGIEVVRSVSDRTNGSFIVTLPINKNYALSVNKDKYNPYSVNFNLTVPENSNEPYHMDVPLEPIYAKRPIRLDNVFFDLDSYVLRKESYVELDLLVAFLNDNPTIKIQLQGHTDAQGDAAHNMKLSSDRAEAVMKYLIQQGIKAERLTSKGFGETQPYTKVVDGKEIELTEDYINQLATEKEKQAAHQLNRRTVYLITAQ